MSDVIHVKIGDEVRTYPKSTSIIEISKEFAGQYDNDILLALKNGKLIELYKKLENNCELEFLTAKSKPGIGAYRRSATLIMLKAFYDVAGKKNIEKVSVQFSISKGYYCSVKGNVIVDELLLLKVKQRMHELALEDAPIKKHTIITEKAIELFRRHKMYDKEKLFRFRRTSRVNIYSLNGFEDYFYGYMVPSSGYIKYFDLHSYDEGFVLQLPSIENPVEVPPFEPQSKLFQVLKQSSRWSEMMEVATVGALNEQITKGNINNIILVQEALQEKRIAEIAEQIVENKDRRIVMIAGPSSSGKTTFSHRLSIQLRAFGIKPHPIAVDDYFVNREYTPKDEFGDYNYEVLEALDVEQFNKDMTELNAGKTVHLPTFNFKLGRREYKGNILQLEKDDMLVIEGIHCLNDRLSYSLPEENKFKIYISALTQLNIDEHNRIPTTDGRLLRRMVRDARCRGTTAGETIARWPSVRKGEERNIFPYQEKADVMFNSALIYELAVLKHFAEPVLFGIPKESPEFLEAKRLLKFLDYFLGVSSEDVPKNSLLREFVGGSCFHI